MRWMLWRSLTLAQSLPRHDGRARSPTLNPSRGGTPRPGLATAAGIKPTGSPYLSGGAGCVTTACWWCQKQPPSPIAAVVMTKATKMRMVSPSFLCPPLKREVAKGVAWSRQTNPNCCAEATTSNSGALAPHSTARPVALQLLAALLAREVGNESDQIPQRACLSEFRSLAWVPPMRRLTS